MPAAAGARFAYGTKALRVISAGGRVTGLVTDRGVVRAGAVVIASGVWTPPLARTAGVRVPIMPVSLSECETTPLPPLFTQSIRAFGFGGHQRPSGEVVLSAGVNAVVRHDVTLYDLVDLPVWGPRLRAHRRDVKLRLGTRRILQQIGALSTLSPRLVPKGAPPPTPDTRIMRRAFAAMREVLPALRDASIRRYWAGMIDMSPDGLPIIDGSAGPRGLVLVTGLSGHGLTIGPGDRQDHGRPRPEGAHRPPDRGVPPIALRGRRHDAGEDDLT
ncbi:NAD(P)/FAD-dependent oxidoreductase [Actinomadura sp. 3N508]|uniref:NAD(P)/FAD-dependent oxidoreductase n=1 Tax=Actinomadura sp. 3N508 TaxID=3375153 RepID=UPI0037ABBE50